MKKKKGRKWFKALRCIFLLFLLFVPYEFKQEGDGQYKISAVLYQITKETQKGKAKKETEDTAEETCQEEDKEENSYTFALGGFVKQRVTAIKELVTYFKK